MYLICIEYVKCDTLWCVSPVIISHACLFVRTGRRFIILKTCSYFQFYQKMNTKAAKSRQEMICRHSGDQLFAPQWIKPYHRRVCVCVKHHLWNVHTLVTQSAEMCSWATNAHFTATNDSVTNCTGCSGLLFVARQKSVGEQQLLLQRDVTAI